MSFSFGTDISTSTFIPNGFSSNGRGMLYHYCHIYWEIIEGLPHALQQVCLMEVLWETVDSKEHHPITLILCRLCCMIITCFVSVLINVIVIPLRSNVLWIIVCSLCWTLNAFCSSAIDGPFAHAHRLFCRLGPIKDRDRRRSVAGSCIPYDPIMRVGLVLAVLLSALPRWPLNLQPLCVAEEQPTPHLTVQYTLVIANSPDCEPSLVDNFPVRVQYRTIMTGGDGERVSQWMDSPRMPGSYMYLHNYYNLLKTNFDRVTNRNLY